MSLKKLFSAFLTVLCCLFAARAALAQGDDNPYTQSSTGRGYHIVSDSAKSTVVEIDDPSAIGHIKANLAKQFKDATSRDLTNETLQALFPSQTIAICRTPANTVRPYERGKIQAWTACAPPNTKELWLVRGSGGRLEFPKHKVVILTADEKLAQFDALRVCVNDARCLNARLEDLNSKNAGSSTTGVSGQTASASTPTASPASTVPGDLKQKVEALANQLTALAKQLEAKEAQIAAQAQQIETQAQKLKDDKFNIGLIGLVFVVIFVGTILRFWRFKASYRDDLQRLKGLEDERVEMEAEVSTAQNERNAAQRRATEQEQQVKQVTREIIDLAGDLAREAEQLKLSVPSESSPLRLHLLLCEEHRRRARADEQKVLKERDDIERKQRETARAEFVVLERELDRTLFQFLEKLDQRSARLEGLLEECAGLTKTVTDPKRLSRLHKRMTGLQEALTELQKQRTNLLVPFASQLHRYNELHEELTGLPVRNLPQIALNPLAAENEVSGARRKPEEAAPEGNSAAS